jgi:hypothetical protein
MVHEDVGVSNGLTLRLCSSPVISTLHEMCFFAIWKSFLVENTQHYFTIVYFAGGTSLLEYAIASFITGVNTILDPIGRTADRRPYNWHVCSSIRYNVLNKLA